MIHSEPTAFASEFVPSSSGPHQSKIPPDLLRRAHAGGLLFSSRSGDHKADFGSRSACLQGLRHADVSSFRWGRKKNPEGLRLSALSCPHVGAIWARGWYSIRQLGQLRSVQRAALMGHVVGERESRPSRKTLFLHKACGSLQTSGSIGLFCFCVCGSWMARLHGCCPPLQSVRVHAGVQVTPALTQTQEGV